ncbi:hypothetical protein JOF57_002271 [Mycolicibacterium lutetiense]|uniref:Transposase n=1 Tax=Mycolicibacterium lutetiense TaxID=1641992 RepID=A0ABS4ZSB4_9MYCO|nr:hypothetical protein [Mycolicibacterium lutetiense]
MCRHLQVTESTWHRWVAQYGGMKANDAKRLKELEAENARLKKLVANQAVEPVRWSAFTAPRCVCNQHRSPITDEEAELRSWLRTFFHRPAPLGLATSGDCSTKAGWVVNNKRIRRLWREEGLRVPQRRKKKRLTGIGTAVGAKCPIWPNVIWAMDFQFDTTADGRTIKMLNIIDEFTRESLAIHVDRAIKGRRSGCSRNGVNLT